MAYNPTKDTLGADLLTNPTATDREPWQEAFKRFSSVPESKVLRASEALSGMSGSWAAQYQFGPAITDESGQPEVTSPTDFRLKFNNLGRPGVSEINFVPYCHGTNRFGNKGGALIGEPISFSVVGPTAKMASKVTWQWLVDPSNPNVRIYLDSIVVDNTVDPWVDTPRTQDLTDLYNIDSLDRFDGGLYLMVTETGHTPDIDEAAPVTGGIGDGGVIQDGVTLRVPMIPTYNSSKTELFRIVDLYNDGVGIVGFELDISKSFGDFFSSGGAGAPVVRHITLVEPAAARMLAVPDSGSGVSQEQVFMMIPPRRALASEHMPIYPDWISTAGSYEYPWSDTFEYDIASESFNYDYPPQIPVGRPRSKSTAYLLDNSVLVASNQLGSFFIDWVGSELPEIGQIVKINSVHTGDQALMSDGASGTVRYSKWGSLLGSFEVIDITASVLTLQRYPEVDPETGISFWGSSFNFSYTGAAEAVTLDCTVHNPIKTLWTSSYFDPDLVDSTRLTNLIDPRWTERNPVLQLDSLSLGDVEPAYSSYRSDKAIFDTSSSNAGADGTNSDPGNLRDLGFRVVVFPAKLKTVPTLAGGTEVIVSPDWDRPITSNEVTIDPVINEKQYIEVDYANGMVRLSHPPQAGKIVGDSGAGDLAPADDIFTAGDNPRGELVLFVACVPYTQEVGQLGAGPRLTATVTTENVDDCQSVEGMTSGDFYDVYGSRKVFPLDLSVPQTINSYSDAVVPGGGQVVVVQGLIADQIPPNGFFELFQDGSPVFTAAGLRASLFSYYGVQENNVAGTTTLQGVHGGGETGVDAVNIDVYNPGSIVIRRELYTPNDLYGVAGVPYQSDLTYGDAKRAGTIRFTGVESVVNLDGSVTVKIQENAAVDCQENMGDMFSSWLLDGGEIASASIGFGNVAVSYTETTIIYQGQRKTLPAGSITTSNSDVHYVYVDGSDCTVSVSDTIPLSDPELILLGKVDNTATTDLRYPLLDLDRRLDIFVGNREKGSVALNLTGPHFPTLASAVTYANELQNPEDGKPDFRVRVRVVGHTDESTADLPITIGADGMTFESNPIFERSGDDKVAIRWEADDACLIDLNGHDNLTFDGLSFHSTSTDTANTSPLRALFTNTGGTVKNLTVNNCRLVGSQGFMAMVGNHIEDSSITNNYGEDLMDFGIYLTNNPVEPLEASDGETWNITMSTGSLTIIRGSETLTVDSSAPGTIAFGTPTIITDSFGATITITDPKPQSTKMESHGEGSIWLGVETLSFEEEDVGSIYTDGTGDGEIWIVSRVMENCIIEGNNFIQADTIGNMADNHLTLDPAENVTIVTDPGFTLRISRQDGVDDVDVVALAGAPWLLTNNGTTAILQNFAPVTQYTINDGDTVGFYPQASTTGTAVITFFNGEDPIIVTPESYGYFVYNAAGVGAGSRILDILHGPNTGPVAAGVTVHTYFSSGAPDESLLFDSITVNQHNRINNNTFTGFHNGIFANILWNSDVKNNYAKSTKNSGIYVGSFAAYNAVHDNALENVFTVSLLDDEVFQWPAQTSVPPTGAMEFGTPVKYGLFLGGLYSEAQSNVVATASYFDLVPETPTGWANAVYDIYLLGVSLEAESNVVLWNIGGLGGNLSVLDNTILSESGAGYNYESSINIQGSSVLGFGSSIIRGNRCAGNIYLNDSALSIVGDNYANSLYTSNPKLNGDSLDYGSVRTYIAGNLLLGNLYLSGRAAHHSDDCQVIGNRCVNIYAGNTNEGPTRCVISQNNLIHDYSPLTAGALDLSVGSTQTIITNNYVGSMTLEGSTITKGNFVFGSSSTGQIVAANSADSQITHNELVDPEEETRSGSITMTGSDGSTISSNRAQGIVIDGVSCVVSDNKVRYIISGGGETSIQNNSVGVFKADTTSTSRASGYIEQGDTSSSNGIISGNIVQSTPVLFGGVETGRVIATDAGLSLTNGGTTIIAVSGEWIVVTHDNVAPDCTFQLNTGGPIITLNAGNPIAYLTVDPTVGEGVASVVNFVSLQKTWFTGLGAFRFDAGASTTDFYGGTIKVENDSELVITGNLMGRIDNDAHGTGNSEEILVANRIQDVIAGYYGGAVVVAGFVADDNASNS